MCLARATSVATDAYFPGVKAGLMELGEAEDLARESGASEAVTATATATAEKLAAGAKEAVKRAESDDDVIDVEEVQDDDGGDVVDAEYSDGDPLVPPGEAESDEQRFAHDLRRFVDGMGQKNTAALIGAGYDSIEKINAVGAKELAAVPGIGPKTVGALMEWAHKESTATEAQQAAQEKAEAPTEEDPKNEPAPAPVPDLPHRPNFRGPDYISALKNFAKDEGIPWADVVSEAGLISGGYPPEKLNDDEWKELGRWVRGGIAQKALLSDDDPDEGETTPAYRIGDVSGDLLTPDRVNTLLRYASREHLGVVGAQDEVGFERWLGETFGIGLATIPVEIEVLLMEWTASSKEDYEEELAAALLDGVLKEVAP